MTEKIELICPAGTPGAFTVAMEEGADAIYLGFNDETNARNFPGLNFSRQDLLLALKSRTSASPDVYVAINTFAQAGKEELWYRAIDDAINLGADAVILADIGLLAYAKEKYPKKRLHLSVQASASNTEAIAFYVEHFGVKRVVLPRVMTVDDITEINRNVAVETEVFAFGGMCPMAEGRCSLSSYITGISPNRHGVCSPASHVRYETKNECLSLYLGGDLINRFETNEQAGYPTLCKGRFRAEGVDSYIFEDPVSLNILDTLPEIINAGVSAIKIEGRQRGKAYVREVVKTYRQAIDAHYSHTALSARNSITHLCEGRNETMGAYDKKWR
jgi:putative protease